MEGLILSGVIGYLVDCRYAAHGVLALLVQRLIDEQRACRPDGRRRAGAANWHPESLIIDGDIIGDSRDIGYLAVPVRVFILDPLARLPGWAREVFILADASACSPGILALRFIWTGV